jgi:hypothetical protein
LLGRVWSLAHVVTHRDHGSLFFVPLLREPQKERLRKAFGLPKGMWDSGAEGELGEEWLEAMGVLVERWVYGNADYSTCSSLEWQLDEGNDLAALAKITFTYMGNSAGS